jgi:hypothetical protein
VEEYRNDKLVHETIFEKSGKRKVQKDNFYDNKGQECAKEFRFIGTDYGNHTDMYWDSSGNIVKLKIYDFHPGSDTSYTVCVNELNRDSTVKQAKIFFDDKLISIIEYTYFSKKLVAEIKTYSCISDSFLLESIEKYTYDNNENKLTYNNENVTEKVNLKKTYSYDRSNKLTGEAKYKNGQLQYSTEYFYKDGLKNYAITTYPETKERCTIRFSYFYH